MKSLTTTGALIALSLFSALTHAFPTLDEQSTIATALKAGASTGKSLKGKFLHVTDIHMDKYYLEGSSPKKYCHRKSKKAKKNTAGRFGALGTKCDSPIPLIEESFKFMKKSLQDIDFIIYTGDTARHDRDDDLPRSKDDVLQEHKAVVKYFTETYNIPDIPLIPTIGNNDMFDHNDLSEKDSMFKTLQGLWKPFNLNLGDTFEKGGYFVQDVIPNALRIINTNSMYFFVKNDKSSDCSKSGGPSALHMDWLQKTLKQSRAKGYKVYIIGHVPPNDDDGSALFRPKCLSMYYNLLGEYGDIIAGHFTGHTNSDVLTAVVPHGSKNSFQHVAAIEDGSSSKLKVDKVATMMFNAPSIIPVNNPAMRVYHYETGSGSSKNHPVGTILDWDQYSTDLEKANKEKKIEYKLEYSASKLFGVSKFDASGVASAFNKMASDKSTHSKYVKYIKVGT